MPKDLNGLLSALAEPSLSCFNGRIMPDTAYPILGVRMAQLRKLAKQYAARWRELLDAAPYESLEQAMVAGLAAAFADEPFSAKEQPLLAWLSGVDCWALTDSVAPALRFSEPERQQLWRFALDCMSREAPYTVRFGIVLLMRFFRDEQHFKQATERVAALRHSHYYVKMAAAWFFAEAAVTDAETVMNLLVQHRLDRVTHNLTLRKLRESYRTDPALKANLSALKRKENEL